MKYVYGPVPSRRLGNSLGIDPIPLKTCNWNCVYCQLGRTTPLCHARFEYVPKEAILNEVRLALELHAPGAIDWITIVGSGEPLLHSGIGGLLTRIQALTPLPVAVITNGAMLFLPEVRADLLSADAVLPTLSAGSAETYLRLHRPHPACTFEHLVSGLIAFRRIYHGQLWVEVMLVKGVNDDPAELYRLAAVMNQVQPDQIHLMLPTRPPAEPWVEPPDRATIERAAGILGPRTHVFLPDSADYILPRFGDVQDAVIALLTRHPLDEERLRAALVRHGVGDVDAVLAALLAGGHAQIIERFGRRFWSAAVARYANRRTLWREGVDSAEFPVHAPLPVAAWL